MMVNPLTRQIERYSWLRKALGIAVTYGLWILSLRLITLTLITYFLMPSFSKLHDISEVAAASEIIVAGLAALSYVCIFIGLQPTRGMMGLRAHFKKKSFLALSKGVIQGSVLALGLMGAFLLSGYYEYLGVLLQFDYSLFGLLNIIFRSIALLVMVFSEEWLFRVQIFEDLKSKTSSLYAAAGCSILYCVIKQIQFDLGIMQTLTLFLISTLLCLRFNQSGEGLLKGVGIWSSLLIMFHPVLGLPILGTEFSGVVTLNYQGGQQAQANSLMAMGIPIDWRMALFLTGGLGGPLSSFALQLVLSTQIMLSLYKQKNILFSIPSETLR